MSPCHSVRLFSCFKIPWWCEGICLDWSLSTQPRGMRPPRNSSIPSIERIKSNTFTPQINDWSEKRRYMRSSCQWNKSLPKALSSVLLRRRRKEVVGSRVAHHSVGLCGQPCHAPFTFHLHFPPIKVRHRLRPHHHHERRLLKWSVS